MTEELGRISGYGGRTYSPIIEGDQAWWIERDDLMDLVEDELHGPLEEWTGTDLVSTMT